MQLLPMHDGPHDSAGDLTGGEWALLVLAVAVLVAVGYAVVRFVQRRNRDL